MQAARTTHHPSDFRPPESEVERSGAESLGEYRLFQRLGAGGVGTVHAAIDVRTGVRCAIKRARQESLEYTATIRREGETLSLLAHDGVVRLRECGPEDGASWFAMELLEGSTLRALMEGIWTPSSPAESGVLRAGTVTTARRAHVSEHFVKAAVGVVTALCAPLAYVHARGFVHADVKPENVMVCDDGRVVLFDFGAAQPAPDAGGNAQISWDAFGTWSYMAPECRNGSTFTNAADVYALGSILHEFLTGYTPAERLLARGLHAGPAVLPGVGRDLIELARRSTVLDPERRPELASFARELSHLGTQLR
jgi:serine/threonine protein kinase